MNAYRLVVRRHRRLLGHFESAAPWSLEAIQDIAARLGEEGGYHLELLVADGEKRLRQSTPQGIVVLSAEKPFRRTALGLRVRTGEVHSGESRADEIHA